MLVGINEAARRARVPKSTIDRNLARGALSFTKGTDGRRLIDTAELERWAQSRPAPLRAQREPASESAGFAAECIHLRAEVDHLRAEVTHLRAELARAHEERRELERDQRTERDRMLSLVERTTTRLLAAPASIAESILPGWLTGRS